MTTPHAAEEFMRSLDQHPEIEQELRRRLLTQELLDLPNTVGKLATAISEMREIFDRRLTSLESQQSENTEQLNSIQQTLNTLDGRVANITGSDLRTQSNPPCAELALTLPASQPNPNAPLTPAGNRAIPGRDDQQSPDGPRHHGQRGG